MAPPNAWLLLAVGDDRQHGGNDGYDDDPDVSYSWDDTVPNHAALKVGDPIALWDKKRLLGASTIEEIVTGSEDKILHRCPGCGRAGIKPRKTMLPRYKCNNGKCKAEFNEPVTRIERVKTYKSRHDAGWKGLEDVLDGPHLRALCVSPKSQLSLRSLRWGDFQRALAARVGAATASETELRVPDGGPGGHVLSTVRVRLGQRAFRKRLLAQQGPCCAFTGPAPDAVLEAGHLYSYAELGVHHAHGGLLLRRDVHRLFDAGALAVNPATRLIDVRRDLQDYPQYARLHGEAVGVPLRSGQIDWLERHWNQHRSGSPAPQ